MRHPANEPANERFLVTGAMGCIGAWTVKSLVDQGATVVTYDKGIDPKRLRLLMDDEQLARITMVNADISDLAALEAALDDHDINRVIHLAALQVPFAKADPPLGALVNVVGTVNVFEAAKRATRNASVRWSTPGSIGMYAADDADAVDGRLHEDADAHPHNHYGVYKLANEGNARVYWLDDGVASVGLRPMVIYGPGRDQGMTSGPTRAILAALMGREFKIAFGGSVLFQYARDAAAAFIAASRSTLGGAHTFNLGGTLASIDDFVAALEAVVPGSAALIHHDATPLPFPEEIDSAALAAVGAAAGHPARRCHRGDGRDLSRPPRRRATRGRGARPRLTGATGGRRRRCRCLQRR